MGSGQRGRVRELGPDPQAQAAAAEEVGSAGRPRAPLCPHRRQRSGGLSRRPSSGRSAAGVRGAGGWGRLAPRPAAAAQASAAAFPGARGQSCPLFLFLAVSSP